jgi:hypothetical protein
MVHSIAVRPAIRKARSRARSVDRGDGARRGPGDATKNVRDFERVPGLELLAV